jgi:hypothetical protein
MRNLRYPSHSAMATKKMISIVKELFKGILIEAFKDFAVYELELYYAIDITRHKVSLKLFQKTSESQQEIEDQGLAATAKASIFDKIPSSKVNRSYLKNAFWTNICVGFSFQDLDILEYACGLKLGPALSLNQNTIIEMASIKNTVVYVRIKAGLVLEDKAKKRGLMNSIKYC